MMGNGHFFVEWKEQFVSQERGHRVVHYFLKDSAGESVLAVIGTERSVRHMFYVVAEEFVSVYGAKNSIHTGFKWRSRREVVDWLTSMLSKQQLLGDRSNSPKHDLAKALDSPEYLTNDFGAQQLQGRPLRNLGGHNSDIVWSGVAWNCGKQLKHYPAFCRNGTKIAIQSFVFVMAKGENQYLAYLEDMYEDKRGKKKVKVRWFHRNQEVKGVVLRNAHPKEVFITPYSQVISAECVDGPATVLTREHYEECFIAFPHASSNRIHLCYRQFRSNRVKPFDLRKLRGYFDQPIVSCLNSKGFPGLDSLHHVQAFEEDEEGDEEVEEELSLSENAKLGSKRTRSGRRCEPFESDYSGIGISDSQMLNFEHSYLQIRNGVQVKKLPPLNHVVHQCWHVPPFKIDEKIELLCQDSGLRGCWFRCTILQLSRKQIKVQYDDLQDADDYGNLEEWVPAFKLAAPDKLGMRCSGRPALRPAPPLNEQTDLIVEVGYAVDAWWSDGWWEGVVTETNEDVARVYFPGENSLLNVHKKDLRISRDWLGDKWIGIGKEPDITSAISANVSPNTKTMTAQETGAVALSSIEAQSGPKLDIIEEEKPDMATTSSDSLMEDVQHSDGGKPLLPNNDPTGDGGNDVDVGHEKTDEVNDNDEGKVGGNDNENCDNCDIATCENSELVRMCI